MKATVTDRGNLCNTREKLDKSIKLRTGIVDFTIRTIFASVTIIQFSEALYSAYIVGWVSYGLLESNQVRCSIIPFFNLMKHKNFEIN